MILRYTKQLPSNERTKIIDAVHLICLRYQAGEYHTSIMMPPRYGKSTVIRLAALELNASTKLPSIMMAPWADNVEQIKDIDSIKQMYERYGIDAGVSFTAHRARSMKTHEWWKLTTGIPTLITCTIGLIQNAASQSQFLDGISDLHQRHGLRVPVFVDEAHVVKKIQQWGKFIRAIVENGGYVILLTGTPVPGIPGFQEQVGAWEEAVRHIPRKQMVDGEMKHFLETYEGEKRTIQNVIADINVSWDEAWRISALARVDSIWIDIEVMEQGQSLGMLSNLSKEQLNGRLRSIEECEDMVCKKAGAGVDRFLQLRSKEKTKKTQILVVTGSDWAGSGDGANIHAQAYLEAIEEALVARGYNPEDFRIEIATGVDNYGQPNDESAKLIKKYRKGDIDILIVKMMGIVGLDVAPCKVLIFGSTLRKGPMAIQALSRVLTTWECRANMILSHDVMMVDLYNRVIKDQGGETLTESNLELVNVEEIPPPPEKVEWDFQNAKVHSYGDEKGGRTLGDYESELLIIKGKYHTNGLSDRQIIENFLNGGFPISEKDKANYAQARKEEASYGIKDLDEGLEKVKGTFGGEAKQIVNKYLNYSDPDWLEKLKELQSKAKQICGVTIDVPKIDDVALLNQLRKALIQAEQMVFGNEQTQRAV
jgi:hypothetical protein